jgi:hypothetical protein
MWRFFRAVSLMAVAVVSGCEELEQIEIDKPDEEKTTVYVIPSGEHYARQSTYQALKVKTIKFIALFDNSAIYKTVDEKNQGDINKLYGVSDCNTPHQTNSARFGWRWYNGKLEIWAYAYVNAGRKSAFITTVALNSSSVYELSFTPDSYVFKVNDISVALPRSCQKEADGYKLYPYFGGDEPAPHEIKITIEDVK